MEEKERGRARSVSTKSRLARVKKEDEHVDLVPFGVLDIQLDDKRRIQRQTRENVGSELSRAKRLLDDRESVLSGGSEGAETQRISRVLKRSMITRHRPLEPGFSRDRGQSRVEEERDSLFN